MRYSEISTIPGSPDEAKNAILDIVTVYSGTGKTEIPLRVILKTMHRQNFDVDERLVIDILKNEPSVKRISDGIVHLSTEDYDTEPVSKDEEEKSGETVKQMAKKSLKKKIGK